MEFLADGLLGGIKNNDPEDSSYDPEHKNLESAGKGFPTGQGHAQRTIKTQCFPVYSVLLALGTYAINSVQLKVLCDDSVIHICTTLAKRLFSNSFSFILLIHEVYQEFQPSYDNVRRWCQGLFRPHPQPTGPNC